MILMKNREGKVLQKWRNGQYVEIDTRGTSPDVGVFTDNGEREGGMELRHCDDAVFINPVTGITYKASYGTIIYGVVYED